MKTLSTLFILFFLFNPLKAQTAIVELGKKVPDYIFYDILNKNEKQIAVQDLKGKIVLLEFWATWCKPCIKSMQKLESIQSEFKDDIEILAIADQSKEQLEKYLLSNKTKLRIISDTLHKSTFGYKAIPHSIVIDAKGIVRAVTGPHNLTPEVLKNFIQNDTINVPNKEQFYMDPGYKIEILKKITALNYSLELTSYDPKKMASHCIKQSDQNSDRNGYGYGAEFRNITIPSIFQALYEIPGHYRIVYKNGLKEDDFPWTSGFQYNFNIDATESLADKERRKHWVKILKKNRGKWRSIAIDFLNGYFELDTKLAEKKMDVYLLKNTDSILKKSTAKTNEFKFMSDDFVHRKVKMPQLCGYLENFMEIPVVDATNLKEIYNIELHWDYKDINTLYAELKKYGLTIEKSEEKLPLEVLEISRKNIKN